MGGVSWKIFLRSATPLLDELISTKRAPTMFAMMRAMVVLPVPGADHNIMDGTRFWSMSPRITPFGPTRSWPHMVEGLGARSFGKRRGPLHIGHLCSLGPQLAGGQGLGFSLSLGSERRELALQVGPLGACFDSERVGTCCWKKGATGLGLGAVSVSGSRFSSQPASMCWLMSAALTCLLHIGHWTMVDQRWMEAGDECFPTDWDGLARGATGVRRSRSGSLQIAPSSVVVIHH